MEIVLVAAGRSTFSGGTEAHPAKSRGCGSARPRRCHFEQAAAGMSDAALRRALAEERDEAGLSLGPTGLAILRYEQERRDERRREHGD
jgi:hypothetical protein